MKFHVYKLGCPKNDVDADYISGSLIDAGHEPVDTPEEAESIIVNTCSFILPAREESINELLRLIQLKKTGRLKTLYVSGCLAQSDGDELLKGMPELDGAFGLGELQSIVRAVSSSGNVDRTRATLTESRHLMYLTGERRFISDKLPYAYLKISDGCNRPCSFCSIPSIRGNYRSRSLDGILGEAEYLARNGKRELILVSQEATLWGNDLQGKPSIIDLLRQLNQIDEIKWIRLMYLYPAMVSDQLIDYMTDDNKTLDYFDLPLQHCSDAVLAAMRRRGDRAAIEALLGRIRARSEEATLRTTFIVGFPGETREHFEELKDFVEKHRFDRLGSFIYSREEGTGAAALPGHISEEEKTARMDELMRLQHDIAVDRNNSLIGKVVEVIIDAVRGENVAQGRTRADCPDIDQEVIVTGDRMLVGQFMSVRIDAVNEYDLVGSVQAG